jgi:hypothetical protein
MEENFELYSEWQLTQPLPEYGFEKDNVVTLVDIVTGDGYTS